MPDQAPESTPAGGSRFGLSGVLLLAAGVLLTALATVYLQTALAVDAGPESSLPVPAVWAIALLVALNAVVGRLRRGRALLSRAQLVLVACGVLMAAPLLTQGFWMRFIGTVTTYPREGQFWVIDALPDRLWPHGADLLAGALPGEVAVDAGQPLEISVPLGPAGAEPGRPHLLSALVRCESLPAGSALVCRVAAEEGAVEAFRLDRPGRADQVRGDGRQRLGIYGLRMPAGGEAALVTFTLEGPGRVLVSSPRLMSVAAVELALRGARPALPEVVAALPPEQRAQAVAAPASLASAAGAAFVAGGGVPWGEWAVCLAAWGSFLLLLMGAALGATLLLHRHWVQAERLPLPLARATALLAGADGGALWRSSWFWGGLAAAGLWCGLRYLAGHHPAVPDPTVAVALKPFVSDPAWARTFDTVFTVNALFLGLALLVELNLLASLVAGFWLFRGLYWLGETTGAAAADPAYPWRYDLCAGAYLAYFAVVVALARRHLAGTLRRALAPGGWSRAEGEPAAPRTALLLIAACVAGGLAWAWWVGVGLAGFAALFAAFLVVAVVAARLRAECGLLFGYFTPYSMAGVLAGLGGIPVFGPQAVLFGLLASMWMATCTMHIPGMQVDACELGRRAGARSAALVGVPLLAVALGVAVGGWAFLGISTGQGGDNLRYAWAYDTKLWYFSGFANEVGALGEGGARAAGPSPWGLGLGAAATGLLALVRQFAAGCWFHPVGLLLGSTHLMDAVWGSCLAALALRAAAVRLGGAEAVRNRLVPAGLGIFAAACLTYLAALVHGAVLSAHGWTGALLQSIP